MRLLSVEGYDARLVCFRSKAQRMAKKQPRNSEPKKPRTKVLMKLRMVINERSDPRNETNVVNKTIATESFKILSPKIIAYSFGSTFNCLNIARTVTGSVELRIAPKIMESRNVMSRWWIPVKAKRNTRSPIMRVEIKVPIKAKVKMAPRLRKKFRWWVG